MSEMLGDTNSTSESKDLTDSDETNSICKNQQNGQNWSELPPLSIEKIYSFLNRTDQCRMSLVCRRWAKEYSSPSLWKTVKFYLSENHYSSDIYQEMRFARKYGSMFRHVEIICNTASLQLLDVRLEQLKFFLQALTSKSQLISIKLKDMFNLISCLDYLKRQDVLKMIVNFFKSQKNLQIIYFRYSAFLREEGVELLKVLSEACSNTLREISLRSYWLYIKSRNESIADLSSIFKWLLNIQTIEIDYTWVFEEMMRLCQKDYNFLYDQNQKFCLSTLNIYYLGLKQPDFRGIPPICWKALNIVCPNLTVNLNLSTCTRNEIERFIARSMRIRTFTIIHVSNTDISPRTDISVLFNYLLDCRANDHLQVVSISWKSTICDLAAAVVPFLRACSKLQTFHLVAKCSVNGVKNILNSLLEDRPSCLKSMTLSVDKSSNEKDEANIKALFGPYYQLFQVIGIELLL